MLQIIKKNLLENERILWGLILLFYTLFISYPLFSETYILGHDFYFHLNRIEGIKEGLLAGQIPVRIHAFQLNGYGFPAGVFYPDLFLYLPALLRLADVPLHTAYNSFCILLNLATAFLTWWAFAKFSRSIRLGALTALFYTGFLYRLANFYSRSALGEMTAMAFLPLALVSVWLMLHRSVRYWPVVVLSCTAVLQSHIISSLFLFITAAFLLLISCRKLLDRTILLAFLKTSLFILLLNLWFFVPFLTFYQNMHFHIQALTIYPLSMFTYTASTMKLVEGFCGFALLGIILLFLLENTRNHTLSTMSIPPRSYWFLLAIGLLFTASLSDCFPWDTLQEIPIAGPHLSIMQFPFRMEEIASIALSFCAAVSLCSLLRKTKHTAIISLLLLCLMALWNMHILTDLKIPYEKTFIDWAIKYDTFTPAERQDILHRKEGLYIDYLYSDIAFTDNQDALRQLNPAAVQTTAHIDDFHKQGTTLHFTCSSAAPADVQLPLFYYPGYTATGEHGNTLALTSTDQHRLLLQVPAGQEKITIAYTGLPFFRAADIVSLLSLLLFLYLLYKTHKQQTM